MPTVVTRSPNPELARCELTHLPRWPIDAARTLAQHDTYQAALREFGVRVVNLPADPAFPDGVFVQDTALVIDEAAAELKHLFMAVVGSCTPRSDSSQENG